ncbi:hypothetical protein FRC18_011250 [Serendipita sp. 400]|nr:hypothetical protein FRC18_011250 [Serendipita sp. 400]
MAILVWLGSRSGSSSTETRSQLQQVGHYKSTANFAAMSVIGTVIVVVLIVGVLSFLVIPAFMAWYTQHRFITRFEDLVREDRIRPILVRNDVEGDDMGQGHPRRKVTSRSFWETWVVEKGKDQELSGSPLSTWKPIAAMYIERPQETCIKDDILSTREQKKQAQKNLVAIRATARNRSNGASISVSPPRNLRLAAAAEISDTEEKLDGTNLGPDIDTGLSNVSTGTAAGKVRLCTLIMMPSISQRRYHGGFRAVGRRNGDDEVVGVIAENGELAPAVRPASPSSNRETLNLAAPMDHGVSSGLRLYHHNPAVSLNSPDRPSSASSSDKDRSSSITELPPIEIGVTESNLEQVSELLELIEREGYRRVAESLVSLEDEREILRPVGTRQHLYPIMYGARPLVVPVQTNTTRQVLLGNTQRALY